MTVINQARSKEQKLAIALALTGTYLIAEVIGGLLTGSLALLSDAAHMLTDVLALVVALVAIRVSKRPADTQRTFGYHRFEILAAAFNAVLLFLVGIYILYEAYWRFQEPPQIQSIGMLVVASVGLLVNIISMRLLSDESEQGLNMKGAYLEVWSDLLGSIAVIVAAIIIHFSGWWPVDPILAVGIGLWVLPRTWTLLNESLNVLLEGIPRGFDLKGLHTALASLPGVDAVHDLHVWQITTGRNSMTVHLAVNDATALDPSLTASAQQIAAERGIEHSSIQVELKDPKRLESDGHPLPNFAEDSEPR